MGRLYHGRSPPPEADAIVAAMALGIALALGAFVALLLAVAIGGLLYENLAGAHKHENTLLPFLHLFVIGCVIFFFVHGF